MASKNAFYSGKFLCGLSSKKIKGGMRPDDNTYADEGDHQCRQEQQSCINTSTQSSTNNEDGILMDDQREDSLNINSGRCSGCPKSQNIIYSPKNILCEPTHRRMPAILSHNDTYNIIQLIGEGVYGEVSCCRKKSTGQFVAVKTLKYDGCIASEVRVLKLFQNMDTDRFHIVQFHECFHSSGKSYLVFELLEQNLLDFQKANNFTPLPAKHIRIIGIQLLRALVMLKELSIIHTDIKLDNIMLVAHKQFPFRVKVIDFGSASILPEVQHINDPYIQARYYRSPEILLGLPFCEKLDMWSVGCVLAELRLGRPLYPGKSQYDQIRIIIEAQGQPKDHLLDQASKTHLFFKRNPCPYSAHRWQLKSLSEYDSKMLTSLEPRRQTVKSLDQLETFNIIQTLSSSDDEIAELHDRNDMVALLKRMLNFDPKMRISPDSALTHPFITMEQLKKKYNHTHYYQLSVQGRDAALNYSRVESKEHSYQLLKEPQCANTAKAHVKSTQHQLNHSSTLTQTAIDKRNALTIRNSERIQRLKLRYNGTWVDQPFTSFTENTIHLPHPYQEACHQVSWCVCRHSSELTSGNPERPPPSHPSRSDRSFSNVILVDPMTDKDRSTIKHSGTFPSTGEGQRNRNNNSGKYSTRSFVIEDAVLLQQEKQETTAHQKEKARKQMVNPNARRSNSTCSKMSTDLKSSPIKTMIRRENMELTLGLLDPVKNDSACGEAKQCLETGVHLYNQPNSTSKGQSMAQMGFIEKQLILIATEEEQIISEDEEESARRGNETTCPRVGHIKRSGIILDQLVLRDYRDQEREEVDLQNIHQNLFVERHYLGSEAEMNSSQLQISEAKDTEKETTADMKNFTIFKLAKYRKRNKRIQKKRKVFCWR